MTRHHAAHASYGKPSKLLLSSTVRLQLNWIRILGDDLVLVRKIANSKCVMIGNNGGGSEVVFVIGNGVIT